jgi:DNA recombination protein RmuC
METILIVLLVAVLFALAFVIYLLIQKSNKPSDDTAAQLIKQDLTELTRGIVELKDGLHTSLTDRMDRNQAMVRESMQKQFAASAKIISDVTERLAKLNETNRQVVDVAVELKTLQNVLQNPKQRGVLGEFYLEQILQNLLPPGSYSLQHKIAEGLIVDAVIHLDGKVLPIDSKFSLENYNRLLDCKPDQRILLARAFKEDLKKRIDETSKYIQPKHGTMDMAFMFIPSEAIYYDLLANKVGASGVSGRDLMHYASVDKRVTIVGPSTLPAMLQVIVQNLRSLEIQKDTEVIRNNVEQLQRHLIAYDGYYKRIGNSLGATVAHYNNATKEMGKIDKDIVKLTGGSMALEAQLLDKPQQEE